MIDDFLTWAERDRTRSPHTIRRYRRVLTTLGFDPTTATREQIEAWWATRYDAAPATRANDLACLRSFYKWTTRFGHRDDDPTRRLDFPKVPIKQPRPAGKSDLERLLGDLTAGHPDLRRAFALGAYGGLRVSEAAGLDWADVDPERRIAYVTGKGVKERGVGISSVLWDYMLPELPAGNVVTGGGSAYKPDTLQRKVNRFMRDHGVDSTFHDLRKRGASLALSRTKNPVAVCQMFGWESLQTAQHYAAFDDDVLHQIADAMV